MSDHDTDKAEPQVTPDKPDRPEAEEPEIGKGQYHPDEDRLPRGHHEPTDSGDDGGEG